MKRRVLAGLALFGLLIPPALAQTTQEAKTLCQQIVQSHPLPVSLQQKLVLGGTDDPALFGDGRVVTPAEAQALYDFSAALAPCRDAMLSALRQNSSALAAEREKLFATNERIMADLMSKRITFGLANQRFSEAQMDYDKEYARLQITQSGTVAAAYSAPPRGTMYGSGVTSRDAVPLRVTTP